MPDLINRIAAARKAAGLTQAKLADLVGAHWITISKLERGKIKLTTEWASKIANAIGVPASDLFLHKEQLNVIKISGYLEDKGEINAWKNASDAYRERQFELDASDEGNSIWLEVKTDDFYPLIHYNDLIKAVVLPTDYKPSSLIDRLVIALVEDEGATKELIGILGPDAADGLFTLRSMAGPPIRRLSVKRIGRVTTVILDPSQIGFAENIMDKHPDHWRERWANRPRAVDNE